MKSKSSIISVAIVLLAFNSCLGAPIIDYRICMFWKLLTGHSICSDARGSVFAPDSVTAGYLTADSAAIIGEVSEERLRKIAELMGLPPDEELRTVIGNTEVLLWIDVRFRSPKGLVREIGLDSLFTINVMSDAKLLLPIDRLLKLMSNKDVRWIQPAKRDSLKVIEW